MPLTNDLIRKHAAVNGPDADRFGSKPGCLIEKVWVGENLSIVDVDPRVGTLFLDI